MSTMKLSLLIFVLFGTTLLSGCFHPNSVYGYIEKYPIEKDGKTEYRYHYHATGEGRSSWNIHYPCPERPTYKDQAVDHGPSTYIYENIVYYTTNIDSAIVTTNRLRNH